MIGSVLTIAGFIMLLSFLGWIFIQCDRAVTEQKRIEDSFIFSSYQNQENDEEDNDHY